MKNFNDELSLCTNKNFKFFFDVGQRGWSRIRVVSDVDEKWNEWKTNMRL